MTLPKKLTIENKKYVLVKVYGDMWSAHDKSVLDSMDGIDCVVLSVIPAYDRDNPKPVRHGYYVKEI